MTALPDYQDLMTRFKRAYGKADPDLLAEVVTADFEWHTHTFDPASPLPTGRVLRGIDEVMAELERRRREWTDLRYDGLLERFAPGLVTQTFTISGVDRGTPFEVAAVDLYDVVEADDGDRIATKQTYWKQPDR